MPSGRTVVPVVGGDCPRSRAHHDAFVSAESTVSEGFSLQEPPARTIHATA